MPARRAGGRARVPVAVVMAGFQPEQITKPAVLRTQLLDLGQNLSETGFGAVSHVGHRRGRRSSRLGDDFVGSRPSAASVLDDDLLLSQRSKDLADGWALHSQLFFDLLDRR